MLDSNTDRLYFIIGAIIVGALIIGGAVFIFNNVFGEGGTLSGIFENMFNRANDGIDVIDPAIIVPAIKNVFGNIL